MTIGTLVKITATKKLMIKISEKSYDMISDRLKAESKRQNYPTDRLATFMLDDDDNESGEAFFAMISLDKYDKLNMRKFEQMLKKDVAVQYRLKPYDFIPDCNGGNRVCGINLELLTIRAVKPKNAKVEIVRPEAWLCERSEEDQQKEDASLQRDMAETEEYYARTNGKTSKEEFPDPPVLERQAGYIRRRCRPGYVPVSAPEGDPTGVLAEVKKIEDLIAANERAIGATE